MDNRVYRWIVSAFLLFVWVLSRRSFRVSVLDLTRLRQPVKNLSLSAALVYCYDLCLICASLCDIFSVYF